MSGVGGPGTQINQFRATGTLRRTKSGLLDLIVGRWLVRRWLVGERQLAGGPLVRRVRPRAVRSPRRGPGSYAVRSAEVDGQLVDRKLRIFRYRRLRRHGGAGLEVHHDQRTVGSTVEPICSTLEPHLA